MAIIKLNNNSLTSVTALPSGVGADPNVKLDLARLGLRTFANQNLAKLNSNSMSYDVFQDATGLESSGVGTNASRDVNEFVSANTSSEQTITINNSNYTTYVDSVQGRQINTTSSYEKNNNEYQNWSLSDNTTYNGVNAGSGSAHLGTKGEYLFGNGFDATSDLWRANNNVGHSPSNYYFHAIGIKLNTTALGGAGFAPTDWGLKWRTGSGNYWWTILYGANSDAGYGSSGSVFTTQRLKAADGGIVNGNSYTCSGTGDNGGSGNTSKATHLWILQFHYNGAQSYGYDNLFFTGTGTVPSLNASGNIQSTAITAPSTSKMGAVITYEDTVGTNILNTDLSIQLSADNGSNYSTATLTALPDFASGVKCASVTDVSVTEGTQLKYKLLFANQSGSKECRVTGVSLQY